MNDYPPCQLLVTPLFQFNRIVEQAGSFKIFFSLGI